MRGFAKRTRLQPGASSCGLPVECWTAILDSLIDRTCWDLSCVQDICNAGALARWLQRVGSCHGCQQGRCTHQPAACMACHTPARRGFECCHAGVASKTLAVASRESLKHLDTLLGDPCPGGCAAPQFGSRCEVYWAHSELPSQLVTDPCSLKARLVQPCGRSAAAQPARHRCQQVPTEQRAALVYLADLLDVRAL